MKLITKNQKKDTSTKQDSKETLAKAKEANSMFAKLIEEQLLISFLYEISGNSSTRDGKETFIS